METGLQDAESKSDSKVSQGVPSGQKKGTLIDHPHREAIIQALIDGESSRSIAARYDMGHNGHRSVSRLGQEVKAKLATAKLLDNAGLLINISRSNDKRRVTPESVAREALTAQPHLERLAENAERLRRYADKAEAEGDLKVAIKAVEVDLKTTELTGRFDRSLETPVSNQLTIQTVMFLPPAGPDGAAASSETLAIDANFETLPGIATSDAD